MSDNDLIRRGDVINVICEMHVGGKDAIEHALPNTYAEDLREIIYEVDDIPAVPQEMSARELFNAYQRICEEYSHKGIPIRCDECPLYSICPEIGRAIRVMVIWSTIIERWAREHPERRSE